MHSKNIQTLIPLIIRRIRLAKKLSQEDLASLAKLDRTYISGIERGVRNISIKSLCKVLKGLEIDTEQFAHELIHENKINIPPAKTERY